MPESIEILKALSDETRYSIIKLLLGYNYCVRALAKRLGISESAVSQHLKILRKAEIVKGVKRGYFTHYYVDRNLLKKTAMEIIELSERAHIDLPCHKSNIKNHLCSKKKGAKNGENSTMIMPS